MRVLLESLAFCSIFRRSVGSHDHFRVEKWGKIWPWWPRCMLVTIRPQQAIFLGGWPSFSGACPNVSPHIPIDWLGWYASELRWLISHFNPWQYIYIYILLYSYIEYNRCTYSQYGWLYIASHFCWLMLILLLWFSITMSTARLISYPPFPQLVSGPKCPPWIHHNLLGKAMRSVILPLTSMDYRGYGRVVVLSQKWRMGLQKEEDPGMTGKNPWLPVDVPGNSSKPLIGGAGSRVYGYDVWIISTYIPIIQLSQLLGFIVVISIHNAITAMIPGATGSDGAPPSLYRYFQMIFPLCHYYKLLFPYVTIWLWL